MNLIGNGAQSAAEFEGETAIFERSWMNRILPNFLLGALSELFGLAGTIRDALE